MKIGKTSVDIKVSKILLFSSMKDEHALDDKSTSEEKPELNGGPIEDTHQQDT